MTTRVAALLLGTAVATALSASPREASAQEANGFGEKHQLMLSVDRLVPVLSYTSQTATSTQGGASLEDKRTGTSAGFLLGQEPSLGAVHTIPRVAFDFTIVNRLTLGGSVAIAFGLGGERKEQLGGNNNTRTTNTPKRTIFGFAPRVGYVLPLGHYFAFWPRVGFAFYSVSTKEDGVINNVGTTTTTTDTVLAIDLDPQFVWVPIPHFFIHAGPIMNIPLTGSQSVEVAQGSSSTTAKNDLSVFHFGLSAGLGGWFDL